MIFSNLNKVAPNSMTARVYLAFLATAGIFYVNILPALVNGLITALNFTDQQAGAVASANLYGAAGGALLIVFFIKKLNWQLTSLILLGILISLDFLSIMVTEPMTLITLRFINGFIGGMLVGTGFSIIARTDGPDRTFGVLLFVQFGLGGLGLMLLPGLIPNFGIKILFFSLMAFSLVTLVMLMFLPAYEIQEKSDDSSLQNHVPARKLNWTPLLLTLFAIFLFQAGNNSLYAYIIGLGEMYGQQGAMITTTLGLAAWLGLVGAALVVVMSDNYGYMRPLLAGLLLTIVGTVAFVYSDVDWIWITANCLIGITWAFTISYLLGLASRFDLSGQMAALGGFASKMGLASGPAAAAYLLGDNDLTMVVWVAAAALTLCLLVVIIPATGQDKEILKAKASGD